MSKPAKPATRAASANKVETQGGVPKDASRLPPISPTKSALIAAKPVSHCFKCSSLDPPADKLKKGKGVQWIACSTCDSWFHCICARISDGDYFSIYKQKGVTWVCMNCLEFIRTNRSTSSQNKIKNNTIVKNSSPVPLPDNVQVLLTEMDKKIDVLTKELSSLHSEINNLNKGIEILKTHSRQNEKKRSLILTNVPELFVKNGHNFLPALCTSVGLPSTFSTHIEIAAPFRQSIPLASVKPSIYKPLSVIRFHKEEHCSEFFRAYLAQLRSLPLTLDAIVPDSLNARVYINEDLDPTELALLHQALLLKRQGVVSKVSTRNRKIYITRKSPNCSTNFICERFSHSLATQLNCILNALT